MVAPVAASSAYTDTWPAAPSFTDTYSRSLQQTLYAMGHRVLEKRPELVEVRLALPNRHHFLVDLAPFGLDNPNEIFVPTNEPFGLISGTISRG